MFKNDQIEIIKYVTNNLIVEGDNEDKIIYLLLCYFIKNWNGLTITNFLDFGIIN